MSRQIGIWTREETFKLIELCKANSVLWDLRRKDFKSREKKRTVLKSIALIFRTTPSEINRKFHNLKGQFYQELRRNKIKKRDYASNEDLASSWCYYDALRFLDYMDREMVDKKIEAPQMWTEMAVTGDYDFWREFISLYREMPELWQVKNETYKDRDKKNEAYGKLVELMKRKDKNANKETVKKKLNTLRGCYRRELKKVIQSERSGAGVNDRYVPSLWYFDELQFLSDQVTAEEGISTWNNADDTTSSQQYKLPKTQPEMSETESYETSDEPPPRREKFDRSKNKRKSDYYEQMPETRRDEDQIFGDYVASALRDLVSPRNKKRLKIMIQKSIVAIQETDDEPNSAENVNRMAESNWSDAMLNIVKPESEYSEEVR